MAAAAPSGGDDKPPESAPGSFTSLYPPADPQRNGESPAPPSGDVDTSAMGVTEILDPAETERGTKLPLPTRPAPCRACARRKMILRGIDPGPLSDDELSPLASALPPVLGKDLPDPRALGTKGSPSAVGWCAPCEFRKKILLSRRLRRNREAPAPPPGLSPLPFMPIPPLDDMSLEEKLRARARRAKKRPPTVEQERGYRECDVGKKLMRHKWDGLHHKWAGLLPDSALEVAGFGAGLLPDSALEVASFGATAERRDLLEKTMLIVQKALRVDDARLRLAPLQGVQKPSSSAAARVDVLHEKLAQMTKVLTKVLHEGDVLQVSTKLMRLLCPEVGSSAAAGGGLDGSDWGLVEKAIDNLVNQTGEGMQDIVRTVIPKVFSKEILYDLLMACVAQYPKWLENNKGRLTQENYAQYQKQLDLMLNLTMVYDDDPENFSKIMKLMCKIGGCGPLPSEVIDDISPGLDPSTMEQLFTEMVELLNNLLFGMVDLRHLFIPNPSSK